MLAQYRRIKSAIHNWAHSFMSIDNYRNETYFVDLIYKASKEASATKVVIDILRGDISPKRVENEVLQIFMRNVSWSFAKQIRKENVEPHMIEWARLEILYDFEMKDGLTTNYSFSDPSSAPKASNYQLKVVAMDDRGEEHAAVLKEWWRT